MTHDANRVLEQVLRDTLSRYRKASAWVREEAELEAVGEVLMGDLVSGDLRTIEQCLAWLETVDVALPVTPVPGGRPDHWSLSIDEAALAQIDDATTTGWIRAMDHLLFGGPQPAGDCPVWENLSSIGLPPGLREDLQDS